MIPKKVYFYWGSNFLPYLKYMSIFSFRKLNPDWDIDLYVPLKLYDKITWESHEQKYNVLLNKDYMEEVNKLNVNVVKFDMNDIGFENDMPEVLKSDVLRLFLLHKYGGVWSDIDILYIKPFSYSLLDLDTNKDYICYCDKYKLHSIGFLLSNRDSIAYKHLFIESKNNINLSQYQSVGSCLFKKELKNYFTLVNNISMDIVYPITSINDIVNVNFEKTISMIKEKTIGIHWYAGHYLLEKSVNKSEEEYKSNVFNIIDYYVNKINKEN